MTAVTAKCADDGVKVAFGRPGRAFSARLGDSKGLVAYGDSALGEAWARALAERTGRGHDLAHPDALFEALSLDPRSSLRAHCPSAHERQCWGREGEAFIAEDEMVTKVRRDLDRLAKRGVAIVRVEVALICNDAINRAIEKGLSRFVVDLHAMERLVLSARASVDADVVAACGKVGGYNRYSEHFGPLGGRLHAILCEGRARSEYQFPGVGRIAFVRDADETHLLVGMASLVGKWVRDLMMLRVVRYHREVDDSLPMASGYHDPVTTRFIAQSALLRRKRGLPDSCFERRALNE
ncbi:hypothetical protein [Pendulispora albinea]|uniref:Uncharacterized protein n=1 Tax=Pendulispora albinea TaxID=2741071 RepID=A0ABZ2M0P4_9BACT